MSAPVFDTFMSSQWKRGLRQGLRGCNRMETCLRSAWLQSIGLAEGLLMIEEEHVALGASLTSRSRAVQSPLDLRGTYQGLGISEGISNSSSFSVRVCVCVSTPVSKEFDHTKKLVIQATVAGGQSTTDRHCPTKTLSVRGEAGTPHCVPANEFPPFHPC